MTNISEAPGPDQDRAHPAAGNGLRIGDHPGEFGTALNGPSPSPADLFLSPHADDICFSLGDLARRRRAGTLLTIFSRSAYVAPRPAAATMSAAAVSELRLAEDAAFAAACGLVMETGGLPDAPLASRASFAVDAVVDATQRLEPLLLDRVASLRARHPTASRPWLFCPSGIGGHVDHVAVMNVVARRIDTLQSIYKVCFYEDLPYASDVLKRSTGLRRLAHSLPRHTLVRCSWELGAGVAEKIDLLRLYPSQFAVAPSSLDDFSPAPYVGRTPHEAVWTVQPRKNRPDVVAAAEGDMSNARG